MFSQLMKQNNNQQQNSLDTNQSQLTPIHETALTKKVLQLEYEMQKTQKCYHTVKKPIKYFSKVKRSLPESKNSQHSFQVRILSQKIIPPNIGQQLTYAQKPNFLQNPKHKNVFQAYKQTLQEKYRKKKILMEKAAIKISAGKIHQHQAACEQIIQQKQEFIKKRMSSKRIDSNIIRSQHESPMHRLNLLQSVRQKQCSSRLFQTIDNSENHNFIRSMNKRPDISIAIPQDHYLSNKQVSIYQVKRKCYSEERENLPAKSFELNKTRNVTFKLPNEKRKSTKHFIERLGGHTYNLPEISDKKNDKSDTISYLVKSLRKPSQSQHFKTSISNPQISIVPKAQQSVQKITIKQRSKRIKTLEPQNDSSILQQYDNQNLIDCYDGVKNFQYLKAHKNGSRCQIKHRKAKRKLAKYNFMGDINGWNTQNKLPEIQYHLMHHFVSLEPTETTFDN